MQLSGAFRDAMARFAGAVTVVTTGHGEDRCGLTATAVCSLSADPPSILVCINSSASAHDAIVRQGSFGVSLLRPDQRFVAERFAGQDGRTGAARFDGSDWIERVTGAPLLAGATVALDCRLIQRFDGYSHSIMIGQVEAIELHPVEMSECLLWHERAFRRIVDVIPLTG